MEMKMGDSGVQYKDVRFGTDPELKARLYLPKSQPAEKLPILLYFHGGGFFEGSAFDPANHAFVGALSDQSRLLAVSVEYRLAPADKLPAAYDDALAALKWVFSGTAADEWLAEHGDLDRVFAAGDSAGANITHNLAMEYQAGAGGEMKIEGIALLCPFFWGVDPLPDEPCHLQNPTVRKAIDLLWLLFLGLQTSDPRVNPLAPSASSLAGLGCDKVFVCLAHEDDLAYARGNAYVEGLKESGWKGELDAQVYQGVGHDFWFGNLESDMAKKLMADLRAFFPTN